MKKLAVIFSFAFICYLLVSCDAGTKGTSDKAQKNIDNSNAVAKMIETGDFSKSADYIATDVVDHAGPQGDIKGLDNLNAQFKIYHDMVTDAKNETVKALADDDYSMIWLKQSFTAKADDPMMGLKAGQRSNMESIEVCKHNADGKITEHWSFASMADMMKMMPQQPPMEPTKQKSDTAK